MKQKKEVGRPQRYKEETKVIAFRVPISAEEKIKKRINSILTKLEK